MKRFDATLALALTMACCVLTTACGPEAVPDSPDEASVSVEVGPDATGIVVVAFGGGPDDARLATMADTIDGAVFTGRPATSQIAGNGDGNPLLEFTSTDVFQPGVAPVVEFDTRHLCDDLAATGITDLEIRLSVPSVSFDSAIVPNQSTSDTTWRIQSCTDSPRGTVVLKPDPSRFWLELCLIIFVIAANMAMTVVGWRGIRLPRRGMLLLAAVAVCASVGVIASAGATAGDNMEVAGRMTHAANQAYFVACLAVVLLGPLVAIAQPFYWRLPREQRPRLHRHQATVKPPPRGDDR